MERRIVLFTPVLLSLSEEFGVPLVPEVREKGPVGCPTWWWGLLGSDSLCGVCPPPLHGCVHVYRLVCCGSS